MNIILASQSPRRRELLSQMGLRFDVVSKAVDESFPGQFDPVAAARYIAEKKVKAFMDDVVDQLVIAADTVVAVDNELLGKPADEAHALEMLTRLSGKKHDVITAVALLYYGRITVFHETTEVYFHSLSQTEITHYIARYRPFDKAGAYGIQEWIGAIGVKRIVGSYTNVVGLPTQRLYEVLKSACPDALESLS